MNTEAEGNDGHYQESPRPQDETTPDCATPSPSKTQKSFHPGCSPVLLGGDARRGSLGPYLSRHLAYHNGIAAAEADADGIAIAAAEADESHSRGASPPLPQGDVHGAEGPTAEELFEDSSYGDEISRWMDHQRHLQQQQMADGARQGGAGDDASLLSLGPTEAPEALAKGGERGDGDEDCESNPTIASENPPKRPSTALPKLSTKRRQRAQPASQAAVPDNRTPSRKRMDSALEERSQSQLELRAALVALRKARAAVVRCRARYNRAKDLVRDTAEAECAALLLEDSPWNEMFHQLVKYRDDAGDCNVKQNFGAEDSKDSPDMVRRLSAWVGKNRKDGKLRGRGASRIGGVSGATNGGKRLEADAEHVPATETDATNDSPADFEPDVMQSDDASVFEDIDPDSIHADPYKEKALDSISFDWNPRNSRWLQMYEELRHYKEQHGNTLVPHAQSGLGAWVKRQTVQYTLYNRNDGTKSDLTEERVRLLNDLGFIWSRRTNTWNENFQRLVSFRRDNGHCHIPDDSKDPLHKWVALLRLQYKRQVADGIDNEDLNTLDKKDCSEKSNGDTHNTTKKKGKRKLPKLSQERIESLQSIGFEFDSRDAKWLQKLDVLLQYKRNHGDFLVPSNYPEDTTLSNWVASQRAQYKLYMKGSKSQMTERRLKILTDAGFPFSVAKKAKKDDRVVFDAKPWLEKFKDFLVHIATHHGSLDNLQKSNPFLSEWVAIQRDENNKHQNIPESKEQIELMKAANFLVSRCNGDKHAELTPSTKGNSL